jgi:hypothetical protein
MSTTNNDRSKAMYNAWVDTEKSKLILTDPAKWDDCNKLAKDVFDIVQNQSIPVEIREHVAKAMLDAIDRQKQDFSQA